MKSTPELCLKFIEFLAANNVYFLFTGHFGLEVYNESFEDFLKRVKPYDYVNASFMWVNTTEGSDFWLDIQNKWRNTLS